MGAVHSHGRRKNKALGASRGWPSGIPQAASRRKNANESNFSLMSTLSSSFALSGLVSFCCAPTQGLRPGLSSDAAARLGVANPLDFYRDRSFWSWFSSITVTPNSFALSSFDPASAPATT